MVIDWSAGQAELLAQYTHAQASNSDEYQFVDKLSSWHDGRHIDGDLLVGGAAMANAIFYY